MAANSSGDGLYKLIKVTTKNPDLEKTKKKLEERLNAKLQLEVGFFSTAKYSTGEYVAQVAYWNEYGTTLSPPRPFFRNAIKDKPKEWLELFRDTQFKTKDMFKSLSIVGTIAKDDIATSITDLSSPPNAPYTIKKKGSSNPLIDTGLMRNSVSYEITQKGN